MPLSEEQLTKLKRLVIDENFAAHPHRDGLFANENFNAAFIAAITYFEQRFKDHISLVAIVSRVQVTRDSHIGHRNLFLQFMQQALQVGQAHQVSFSRAHAYQAQMLIEQQGLYSQSLLAIHGEARNLGIRERFLAHNLTRRHELVGTDVARILHDTNCQGIINFAVNTVEGIGMALHFARKKQHAAGNPYSVNLILNCGSRGYGQGSHWVALSIFVDPHPQQPHTPPLITYRYHDSQGLSESQKVTIRALMTDAIQYQDPQDPQFYAFPAAHFAQAEIVHEADSIVGSREQRDGYTCGYRALVHLLQQPHIQQLCLEREGPIEPNTHRALRQHLSQPFGSNDELVLRFIEQQLGDAFGQDAVVDPIAQNFLSDKTQEDRRKLIKKYMTRLGGADIRVKNKKRDKARSADKPHQALMPISKATKSIHIPMTIEESASEIDYAAQLHGYQSKLESYHVDGIELVLPVGGNESFAGLIAFASGMLSNGFIELCFDPIVMHFNEVAEEEQFLNDLFTTLKMLSELNVVEFVIDSPGLQESESLLIHESLQQKILQYIQAEAITTLITFKSHANTEFQKELDKMVLSHQRQKRIQPDSQIDSRLKQRVHGVKRKRPKVERANLSIEHAIANEKAQELDVQLQQVVDVQAEVEQETTLSSHEKELLRPVSYRQFIEGMRNRIFNIPAASYLISEEKLSQLWRNLFARPDIITMDNGDAHPINQYMTGISRGALEQILQNPWVFLDGIDYFHLPLGFELIHDVEEETRLLHFKTSGKASKKTPPPLSLCQVEKAVPLAICHEMVAYVVKNYAEEPIIATYQTLLETPYHRQKHQLLSTHLHELIHCSQDNAAVIEQVYLLVEDNGELLSLLFNQGQRIREYLEELGHDKVRKNKNIYAELQRLLAQKKIAINKQDPIIAKILSLLGDETHIAVLIKAFNQHADIDGEIATDSDLVAKLLSISLNVEAQKVRIHKTKKIKDAALKRDMFNDSHPLFGLMFEQDIAEVYILNLYHSKLSNGCLNKLYELYNELGEEGLLSYITLIEKYQHIDNFTRFISEQYMPLLVPPSILFDKAHREALDILSTLLSQNQAYVDLWGIIIEAHQFNQADLPSLILAFAHFIKLANLDPQTSIQNLLIETDLTKRFATGNMVVRLARMRSIFEQRDRSDASMVAFQWRELMHLSLASNGAMLAITDGLYNNCRFAFICREMQAQPIFYIEDFGYFPDSERFTAAVYHRIDALNHLPAEEQRRLNTIRQFFRALSRQSHRYDISFYYGAIAKIEEKIRQKTIPEDRRLDLYELLLNATTGATNLKYVADAAEAEKHFNEFIDFIENYKLPVPGIVADKIPGNFKKDTFDYLLQQIRLLRPPPPFHIINILMKSTMASFEDHIKELLAKYDIEINLEPGQQLSTWQAAKLAGKLGLKIKKILKDRRQLQSDYLVRQRQIEHVFQVIQKESMYFDDALYDGMRHYQSELKPAPLEESRIVHLVDELKLFRGHRIYGGSEEARRMRDINITACRLFSTFGVEREDYRELHGIFRHFGGGHARIYLNALLVGMQLMTHMTKPYISEDWLKYQEFTCGIYDDDLQDSESEASQFLKRVRGERSVYLATISETFATSPGAWERRMGRTRYNPMIEFLETMAYRMLHNPEFFEDSDRPGYKVAIEQNQRAVNRWVAAEVFRQFDGYFDDDFIENINKEKVDEALIANLKGVVKTDLQLHRLTDFLARYLDIESRLKLPQTVDYICQILSILPPEQIDLFISIIENPLLQKLYVIPEALYLDKARATDSIDILNELLLCLTQTPLNKLEFFMNCAAGQEDIALAQKAITFLRVSSPQRAQNQTKHLSSLARYQLQAKCILMASPLDICNDAKTRVIDHFVRIQEALAELQKARANYRPEMRIHCEGLFLNMLASFQVLSQNHYGDYALLQTMIPESLQALIRDYQALTEASTQIEMSYEQFLLKFQYLMLGPEAQHEDTIKKHDFQQISTEVEACIQYHRSVDASIDLVVALTDGLIELCPSAKVQLGQFSQQLIDGYAGEPHIIQTHIDKLSNLFNTLSLLKSRYVPDFLHWRRISQTQAYSDFEHYCESQPDFSNHFEQMIQSIINHAISEEAELHPTFIMTMFEHKFFTKRHLVGGDIPLKVISILLNNGIDIKRHQVSSLLDLLLAEERILELLAEFYLTSPYPSLTLFLSWHEEFKVEPFAEYMLHMQQRYQAYDREPCDREVAINGFKLAIAEKQCSLFNPTISTGEAELFSQIYKASLGLIRTKRYGTSEILTKLNKLKKRIQSELSDGPLSPETLIHLIVYNAELLYRAKGTGDGQGYGKSFEINTTQYLAIYNMLRHGTHVTSQIATGEGKSRIMMLTAACQFCMGRSVDFVTSNMGLAKRDFLEYQPFFNSIGARTSLIFSDTPASAYQVGGINFSDAASLSLFRNKARAESPEADVIDAFAEDRVLLVDEADVTYFDVASTRYNYSSTTNKALAGMTWIYPFLMDYFRQDDIDKTGRIENLFYNDIDGCTNAFIQFINEHPGISKEQKEQFEAITRDQIEVWHDAAMAARALKLNQDYIIEKDVTIMGPYGPQTVSRACILAQHRMVRGAKYAGGVQQCLHAELNYQKEQAQRKERHQLTPFDEALLGCDKPLLIEAEKQIIYSTDSGNLLEDYRQGQIIGVSGTTGSHALRQEAELLYQKDGRPMQIIDVPLHHQSQRIDHLAEILQSADAQYRRMRQVILQNIANDQPIVLICEDDNESAELQRRIKEDAEIMAALEQYHQGHAGQYLHRIDSQTSIKDEETLVREQVGRAGHITISTDRIGRGTDIRIHDEANIRGLSVLLTYLPSERQLRQIRGRAGRFGAHGETHMILDKNRFRRRLQISKLAKSGFDKSKLSEEFIRVYHQKLDLEAQAQRLIKYSHGSFIYHLEQRFFREFRAELEPADTDAALEGWQHFFKNINTHWATAIWPHILTHLQEEPIVIASIDKYIQQFNKYVAAQWQVLQVHCKSLHLSQQLADYEDELQLSEKTLQLLQNDPLDYPDASRFYQWRDAMMAKIKKLLKRPRIIDIRSPSPPPPDALTSPATMLTRLTLQSLDSPKSDLGSTGSPTPALSETDSTHTFFTGYHRALSRSGSQSSLSDAGIVDVEDYQSTLAIVGFIHQRQLDIIAEYNVEDGFITALDELQILYAYYCGHIAEMPKGFSSLDAPSAEEVETFADVIKVWQRKYTPENPIFTLVDPVNILLEKGDTPLEKRTFNYQR